MAVRVSSAGDVAGSAEDPEAGNPAVGIRGRFRSQVRDEVKAAALRQLVAGGPTAVSMNAIARELGVSGPALYRYFTGREELLDVLVLDAYRDLAETLAGAANRRRGHSPERRLRSVVQACREWAVAEPHRYRLLFAPVFPGADAHSAVLLDAAAASMTVLLGVLADVAPTPTALPVGPLAAQLERLAAARHQSARPALHLAAVCLWSRLHGLIGLELGGNTASMGLDPELLVDHEVTALLTELRSSPGRA
jgi:AcrR family transcriptional regulator